MSCQVKVAINSEKQDEVGRGQGWADLEERGELQEAGSAVQAPKRYFCESKELRSSEKQTQTNM